ncbi:hypothetical protein IMY05_018G0049200 [Salix suchowensis]|nr:hypothetical protein IMY05_018G0049200 [Salix suchowensis]
MKNVAKCDTWCELQNPASWSRARLPGCHASSPPLPSAHEGGGGYWSTSSATVATTSGG